MGWYGHIKQAALTPDWYVQAIQHFDRILKLSFPNGNVEFVPGTLTKDYRGGINFQLRKAGDNTIYDVMFEIKPSNNEITVDGQVLKMVGSRNARVGRVYLSGNPVSQVTPFTVMQVAVAIVKADGKFDSLA